MNPQVFFHFRRSVSLVVAAAVLSFVSQSAGADPKARNPASKIYVSDITGESQIDTGQRIEDLVKKGVYAVQGTVIETKRKSTNALVYSNGTGVFFDHDTRVEVKRFVQEPFTPNRTDMETEPSMSQTQALVVRGLVGICTSRLVAGSNMTYRTPHATVNIRGRKLVIEANDDVSIISMLEGDSTVHAGPLDLNGRILREGEYATLRRGPPDRPNTMEIEKISGDLLANLEDKITVACMAKRTVFFDTAEQGAGGEPPAPEIVAITVVPTNLAPGITISPSTLIPAAP